MEELTFKIQLINTLCETRFGWRAQPPENGAVDATSAVYGDTLRIDCDATYVVASASTTDPLLSASSYTVLAHSSHDLSTSYALPQPLSDPVHKKPLRWYLVVDVTASQGHMPCRNRILTRCKSSLFVGTLNPQPSPLTPQPSTLNPPPPTHNHQPSTLNPPPSTLNSQH